MEGQGVAVVTTADTKVVAAAPSSTPRDLDEPPVRSPEITDTGLEQEEEAVVQPSDDHQPSQISTLSDDLRDKIIKQVEYYFSDENLPTDKFLLNYVAKDKEGFVPVGVVASFRKMNKLTQDRSLIVAALKESSRLVLSSNGKKVRRLHPLPVATDKDTKLCTVLVGNLPEDHSMDNIGRIFGEAGKIKNICISDPHDAKELKKRTMVEKLLSGKLHALVEYETMEGAEKAVAMLNNEQDWRYGMRVKLLKRVDKHGQKKKAWKEADNPTSDPAGHEENHYSSEHHDDTHDEEEHLFKDKNEHKSQNRRRGRGQKYRGMNGHGHGTISSFHGNEPPKPPPGPKMPDGTRGFIMGRGRPPALNEN